MIRQGTAAWHGLLVLAALLSIACKESVGPPSGLTVTPRGFDLLELSWSPPSGGAGSYDLDARIADGAWEVVEHGIPGDVTGGYLTLEPTLPELLTLGFRLRAVKGGKSSDWVEASWLRGVRPPVTTDYAVVGTSSDGMVATGPIQVTWQNQSLVATEVQLVRTPMPAASPEQALPVTFGATTYLDDDGAEETLYRYRVRYGTGGVWSDWAEQSTLATIVLLPPKDLLVAAAPGGGVLVTWTPRSTRSNSQELLRLSSAGGVPDVLPMLPATASSFVDPIDPFWPVLRYQLLTIRTEYFPVTIRSAAALIQPFTIPGPPALLASSRLLMSGEVFARDSRGLFHVGSMGLGQPYVSRAIDGGHEEHVLGDIPSVLGGARLGVDGADHLHVIYGRVPVSYGDPFIATHEWHDGTTWQREDPPLTVPWGTTQAMFWADVAASGAVHLLVSDVSGGAQHAFKEGGAWGTTSIAAGNLLGMTPLRLGVAPDGTAYTLTTGSTTSGVECRLRVRPPGGAWGDEEAVPGCLNPDGVWLLPADGGKAAVLIGVDGADIISTDFYLARRDAAGGYSSPELIVNRAFNGSSFDVWAASSADGTRAALIVDRPGTDPYGANRTALQLRDAAGTWSEVTLGPGTTYGWLPGFDGAGKAWALGRFSWLDAAPVPYALFEEQ